MRAALPDYISKVRKMSKTLKRLETSERIDLFGKQFKPEAGHLDRYADYLETALESFKDAGTKGSLRPFYLLCMSYHLRSVYPERWRGHWMRKSVHADIRDFVNAGFMAYDIDNDVTEDQIRHLCERFQTRFPALAKLAEEQARERPGVGINFYEALFQKALNPDPDNSAE